MKSLKFDIKITIETTPTINHIQLSAQYFGPQRTNLYRIGLHTRQWLNAQFKEET